MNSDLGQVCVIANSMFFSAKLAVIHWQNSLVSLQFGTLRRIEAFLCEFNRLFLRKSMCF